MKKDSEPPMGGGAGGSHNRPAPPSQIEPPRLDGLHPGIKKTADATYRFALPALMNLLPGSMRGVWKCVEADQREAYKTLDRQGYDWQLDTYDTTSYGVSTRMQAGYNEPTFTVRHKLRDSMAETEYQRYERWVRSGFTSDFPKLVIQGYYDPQHGLKRAAITTTRVLWEVMQSRQKQIKWVAGGNEMLVVPWSWFRTDSRWIVMVEGDGDSQKALF